MHQGVRLYGMSLHMHSISRYRPHNMLYKQVCQTMQKLRIIV